jgi:small subunit ribosomal protein S4
MGTPRKHRRKFTRPKHPWKTDRINEEKELCVKYGLRNKKEVWKAKSMLGRIREHARRLLALSGEEAEKEKKDLMDKLNRLGISIKSVDDILGLTVENLLDRRLQSVVHSKGFANTPKQARQFIVHNHISVGSHRVSVPGYMVRAAEEDNVKLNDIIKVEQGAARDAAEAAG